MASSKREKQPASCSRKKKLAGRTPQSSEAAGNFSEGNSCSSGTDELDNDSPPASVNSSIPKSDGLVDKRRHQLPSTLEEASDDEDDFASDDDDTAVSGGSTVHSNRAEKSRASSPLKASYVKSCVVAMKNNPSVRTIRNLTDTFVSLASKVAGDIGDDDSSGTAHTLFNYILKECLQEFAPKLRRVTRLDTLQHEQEPRVAPRRGATAREVADASINQQVQFLRSQSQEWKQLRVKLRGYLISVLQVLDAALVSSNSTTSKLQRMQQRQQQQVQRIIFRHIVALLPFYLASAKCTKFLIQTLIRFWSESDDEDVRVLVFISIMRVIRHSVDAAAKQSETAEKQIDAEDAVSSSTSNELLQMTIKRMYAAFLSSSKDTSVNTMPAIQFMQHSLVELLCLQPQAVYELAFTSIRQLASTLRNAILAKSQPGGLNKFSRKGASGARPGGTDSKTKRPVHKAAAGKRGIRRDKSARGNEQERGGVRDYHSAVKQVYSWPFVHAATLWCRLLARQHQHPLLGQLVHPIAQTLQGAIALEPSARNLPVRYHFIRALTLLVAGTHGELYVPLMSNAILAPLLAPWCQTLLSKSPSRVGYKPHNWRVMLKLSEAQMKEDAARDMLIDAIHDASMEYLGATCHLLSFPECLQMSLAQLRAYAKSSTAARCTQLTQVMRLLKRHIVENCEYMLDVRRRYFTGSDIRKVGSQVREVEKCLRLGTTIPASSSTDSGDDDATLEKRPPFAVYFDTWKEKRRDELTKHGIDAATQAKAQTGGKPRAPPAGARRKSHALRTGEDAVPSYAEMATQRAQAREDFMADLAADDGDDLLKTNKSVRIRKQSSRRGVNNDETNTIWADDELQDADDDGELLTIKKQVAL